MLKWMLMWHLLSTSSNTYTNYTARDLTIYHSRLQNSTRSIPIKPWDLSIPAMSEVHGLLWTSSDLKSPRWILHWCCWLFTYLSKTPIEYLKGVPLLWQHRNYWDISPVQQLYSFYSSNTPKSIESISIIPGSCVKFQVQSIVRMMIIRFQHHWNSLCLGGWIDSQQYDL